LFFEVGASALEFQRGGAERFGDIFVHGQALEVRGVEHGEHVQGDVERRFGVVEEIADDGVVFAKFAVVGDHAKDFVGEVGHGRESLDFLVGEARGLQYGALHDFIVVADKGAAGFGGAFDGELHALSHGHFGDTLQKGLAASVVGLRGRCSFRQSRWIGKVSFDVQIVKLGFLIGTQGSGMFEGRSQRGRFTDAVQLFEERLDAESGKVAHDGQEEFRFAFFVLNHGIANARFVREILCGVGEKSGQGILAAKGLEKRLQGLRKKRVLGAVSDHFVLIGGNYGEHFGAIGGSQMSSAGADGEFALAGGASVAQVVNNLRAESFH